MNKLPVLISLILGMLIVSACSAEAEPASPDTITGVVWQWESVTEQPTGDKSYVPDPQSYTIIFNEDGTSEGKADCNNIAGTYSQENGFTITVGPSTMAFCGENSLDQQYIMLLNEVVAGGPDGAGDLALETPAGQMRMSFSNGGTAS